MGNKYQKYPEFNHAIIAPSYRIMQQATLPKFFEIWPEYRKYYSVRNEIIRAPGFGNIYIRSADKPISLEGMTVKSIWADEPGQMSRYAWLIMQGRTATTKGQIFLTSRAYGVNWLKKEFYDFWEKGDPNYEVIEFESRANPGFPEEEWNRAKAVNDPRVFAMMYQGRFSEMIGRIYEQFDVKKHIVSHIPFEKFTKILGGVDWGYNHPNAVILAGFTRDNVCFVFREYYKSGITLEQLGSQVTEFKNQFQVETFFADPSEPMNIQTFREMKIPIMEAYNKVMPGINKVRTKLNEGKLFIHESCKNLLDEFETYQYSETKGERELKEEPVKKNDDGLDALRYLIATSEQSDTSVIGGVYSDRDEKEITHIEQFINNSPQGHWLAK